ncbi:MAG: beta-hydroxyacyl-ACP dehydratase [Planctomycetes bacterium]|nr:beta-hydroxyacyl-ACP dehydratase [Planctomycetota bacterium]
MSNPDVLRAIPHRPPFLFVDRIVEQGEARLVTERTFRADEAFFAGHYPGSPLTPGVLLCEACFQTGAILLMAQGAPRGSAGAGERMNVDTAPAPGLPAGAHGVQPIPMLTRIQDAKFKNQVLPGETCRVEVTLDEKMGNAYLMTGKVTSGVRKVLTVQFIVAMIEKP